MTRDNRSIVLALSGGGFRAALFGLGGLWRLNEMGLLGQLDRIIGVSGGAILAGFLARNWEGLAFSEGRAKNFEEVVSDPLREFCERTLDMEAGILGALTPFKSAGEYVSDRLDKELFHGARLRELPGAAPGGAPEFVLLATNMKTGGGFRFYRDRVADGTLGSCSTLEVSLADAVAASCAFPPIFSPLVFHSEPGDWDRPLQKLPSQSDLHHRLVLADGSLYDNLGLEASEGVDLLLASDGGDLLTVDSRPFEDELFQLGRVRDILIDRTRALSRRELTTALEAGRRQGAFWGIDSRMEQYGAQGGLTGDNVKTERLRTLPTRLCRFDERDQGRLVNWGYALADAALRSGTGLTGGPAAAWPEPQWHLE